jgi:hypothetical protein
MLVLAKFAKDKPAVLGATIVLLIAIVAILAPLLAPYPADVSASHRLAPKAADLAHPFTDSLITISPRAIWAFSGHRYRADGGRHLDVDRRAARARRRLLPGLGIGGDHARH